MEAHMPMLILVVTGTVQQLFIRRATLEAGQHLLLPENREVLIRILKNR